MRRGEPQGSILIIALWSIMILGIFAVSLGAGVRQRLVLADRLETADKLAAISSAGIEAARSVVRRPDETENTDSLNEEWALAETLADKQIEGGSFTAVIQDEERKINLNRAEPLVLAHILQKVGNMDQDKALETAFCITDWRDPDFGFQNPDYGAEDDYYDDLELPYESKDAPFEAADELLLVKGVKREVFDKIRPFITVDGTGVVNVNTAPEEVLEAIGLPEGLSQKILAFRAGQDKTPGTPDDQIIVNLDGLAESLLKAGFTVDAGEQAVFKDIAGKELIGIKSSIFLVRSRGKLKSTGAAREAEAVIDRKGRIYFYRMHEVIRR